MHKVKKSCQTTLLLLLAQFILVYFHCRFNFQDVWAYTLNYWHNYLFNILVLYVLYLCCLVLFNRQKYAWFCFFTNTVLFAMADYLKLSYRSEPLLPSDFTQIFELCGWSETKVVTVFSIVTLLACVIGVLAY